MCFCVFVCMFVGGCLGLGFESFMGKSSEGCSDVGPGYERLQFRA